MQQAGGIGKRAGQLIHGRIWQDQLEAMRHLVTGVRDESFSSTGKRPRDNFIPGAFCLALCDAYFFWFCISLRSSSFTCSFMDLVTPFLISAISTSAAYHCMMARNEAMKIQSRVIMPI